MTPKPGTDAFRAYDRVRAKKYYWANSVQIRARRAKHRLANLERYHEYEFGRAKERKAFLIEQKSKPCTDCGVSYPHYVMDFDHRDPNEKIAEISNLAKHSYARSVLETEIAKCDLVCANCHRIRTHERGYIRPRKESVH